MKITFRDVVVPGRSGAAPDRVDVVIDGGRVDAIVPTGQITADGDERVDGSGGFLVTGLTDGHVHFPEMADPVADLVALEYLASGITSVFCMHGTSAALGLRDRIRAGRCPGPRITTTGPWQDDSELTLEQGRAVAGDHAAAGYDAIKVYSRLSAAGFGGIMQGAQAANLPVVGHVVRSVGLRESLRPPQTHIAHLEEFVYSFLDLSVEALSGAEPIDFDADELDRLAAELNDRGISVGTTIQAIRSAYEQVRDADAWFAEPEVACLPRHLLDEWRPPNNVYVKNFDAVADAPAFARIVELVKRLAVEFHQRGVRLVAGTDALHSGIPHGSSLYRELRDLVDAGLTHAEAFRSCLTPPLGPVQQRPGEFGVGYSGDLVLLGGDPFAEVSHVREVRGVYVLGRYLSAARMREAGAALRDRVGGATSSIGPDR